MDEKKESSNDPVDPVQQEAPAQAPTEQMTTGTASDLPFLVTHWLAHYHKQPAQESSSTTTPEEREAIQRIRRAASELSSAFHALGSFGTTSRVSPNNQQRLAWCNIALGRGRLSCLVAGMRLGSR